MTGVPDCDAIPFDQGHGQAALFKQICRCYSGNAGTDDQTSTEMSLFNAGNDLILAVSSQYGSFFITDYRA